MPCLALLHCRPPAQGTYSAFCSFVTTIPPRRASQQPMHSYCLELGYEPCVGWEVVRRVLSGGGAYFAT